MLPLCEESSNVSNWTLIVRPTSNKTQDWDMRVRLHTETGFSLTSLSQHLRAVDEHRHSEDQTAICQSGSQVDIGRDLGEPLLSAPAHTPNISTSWKIVQCVIMSNCCHLTVRHNRLLHSSINNFPDKEGKRAYQKTKLSKQEI